MQKSPHNYPQQKPFSNKYLPQSLDKTFSNFIHIFNHNPSLIHQQISTLDLIKQYHKQFYQQQISLLLQRIQKINTISKEKDIEISLLNQQLQKINTLKTKTTTSQNITTSHQKPLQKSPPEQNPTYHSTRLKHHYLSQIDRMKADYQKKLRQLSRDKDNQLTSTKLSYQSLLSQQKSQITILSTKNTQLLFQLTQLKQQPLSSHNLTIQPPSLSSIQLQSYKQQNALLRSFIQKIQLAKNKIQQLQSSRIKQKKQFQLLIQQYSIQKKQLLSQINTNKIHYQNQLELLQKQLNTKNQQISKLKQYIQQENTHQQLNKLQQKYHHLPISSSNQITQSKIIDNQYHSFSKLQQSLRRLPQKPNHKATQQQQIYLQQIQFMVNKQLRYYQQIQRLRIERNQLAIQNLRLQQQLTNNQQHHKSKYQQLTSRITSLTSKASQPQKTSNKYLIPSSPLSPKYPHDLNKLKIFQLQQQLFQYKQKLTYLQRCNQQLQTTYQTKQNSLKLSIQLSQNSYKQLWQHHTIINEQYRQQLQNNNHLKQQIITFKSNLQQKQLQITSIQQNLFHLINQNNQLNQQCLMWKVKFQNIFKQYSSITQEIQQNNGNIHIQKYHQSSQISNSNNNELLQPTSLNSTKKQQQTSQNIDITKKQITTLFQNQHYLFSTQKPPTSHPPFQQHLQYHHTQISQINSTHQSQLSQLKSYISELLQQNQKIKQTYLLATNSWKQMYQSIIKCNYFLSSNREQFQNQIKYNLSKNKFSLSSCKREQCCKGKSDGNYMNYIANNMEKREDNHISILKNTSKIQPQQHIQTFPQQKVPNPQPQPQTIHQQQTNSQQIYPYPDFSQKKLIETSTINKLSNINKQNPLYLYQQFGRNIRNQLDVLTQRSNQDIYQNINIEHNLSFVKKQQQASYGSRISFINHKVNNTLGIQQSIVGKQNADKVNQINSQQNL